MGSGPGNLLMLPAVAAAAAASMAGNGFLPATHAHAHAHLQQLFAKTTNGHYVASPMTPQASPSAPSSVTSGGRPSSPRNVTPDTTRSPVIVVTEATESSPAKTAAAEAGRSASSSPSPASRLQLHSRSPSRRTPLPDQSLSTSPKHIFGEENFVYICGHTCTSVPCVSAKDQTCIFRSWTIASEKVRFMFVIYSDVSSLLCFRSRQTTHSRERCR